MAQSEQASGVGAPEAASNAQTPPASPDDAPVDPIKDAIDSASGDVYVPSTAEVREAYVTAPDFMPYSGPAVKGAEFDAWLEQVQDEARNS